MAKKDISLKNQLILFNYFLDKFGVNEFYKLRELLAKEKEYFDEEGHSYYFKKIKDNLILKKISDEKLKEYDENIKSYLIRINRYREPKINLKYFQYLAVLWTEIFLDNFFNEKEKFLEDINKFVKKFNEINKVDSLVFVENDLTKLAYWMATGSGKTLIMHINYLQFIKYNQKKINYILLITPNESLSKQHLGELEKSGIEASLFTGSNKSEGIEILDIYKLTETKKGKKKGKTVEVSSFEGNNLIFVDEGHKGFSGSEWKKLRDKIAEVGFTFEYSATFDEAIGSSEKNINLLNEYSKSITMDYSYQYFYEDGFGKKFTVMNLKEGEYKKQQLIFTLNFLSYYQQLKYYEDNLENLKLFNFDKPLWIFVGSSVIGENKNKKIDKETISDVQAVVSHINDFLKDKNNTIKLIDEIIKGEIKFAGKEGVIYPVDELEYIRDLSAKEIYQDIVKRVFHSDFSGSLELSVIKNTEGEIGLKVSTSEKYFGLVFIGDVSLFKERIPKDSGIILREDVFVSSLFSEIIDSSSPVNILIGAKKFIEGWDCYRVSSMGLLNIGKSKGSQIMQLFGRGVRLRGYKKLMKRSEYVRLENSLEHEELEKLKTSMHLDILEALKIFGIKADYVKKFEEELQKQKIYSKVPIQLELKINKEFLSEKLLIPMIAKERYDEVIKLKLDDNMYIPIFDISSKFEMGKSSDKEIKQMHQDTETINLKDYQEYINWDNLYFEILQYKKERNFLNLYIDKTFLQKIVNEDLFKIKVDKSFKVYNFKDSLLIQKWAILIFKKYINSFYNKHRDDWGTKNIGIGLVREKSEFFKSYTVGIEKRKENIKLIEEIKELINEGNKIYKKERTKLPAVYFDRHLYQPLIVDEDKEITSHPPALNTGEKKLIDDLKKYFSENNKLIKKNKFFILRNISKSGIGFFTEEANFYPDFIIWVINDVSQKIIFVDPHGLQYTRHSFDDSKINFSKKIKEIETVINKKFDKKTKKFTKIELYSFIIHSKDFNDVKGFWADKKVEENDFYEHNVLFQEESNYIDTLFRKIMSNFNVNR